MKIRLRFSLKLLLLLIAVIAMVLGVIIVPKYRSYADLEYLRNHPAVHCGYEEFNSATGIYGLLGIKNIYEKIDNIEITFTESMPHHEIDRLLAIVDQHHSITCLRINGIGKQHKLDLRRFFKHHEFQRFEIADCSISQDDLSDSVMQAESLSFQDCHLEIKEQAFSCKKELKLQNCDLSCDHKLLTISADSADLIGDQLQCEKICIQLRGRASSYVDLNANSDMLKSIQFQGVTRSLSVDGKTDRGDSATIAVDVSGLEFESASIQRVQKVIYRKSQLETLSLENVENKSEIK